MNIRIGYIPYLNMAPFHQGFGPEPVEVAGCRFEFRPMSPRTLGLEAEKGNVDAGAMSLVDCLRLSKEYGVLGSLGIGIRRDAQSVLVFSRKPLSHFQGTCAVTDETSTSFKLLQVILETRYGRTGIHYGRIPSSMLFDGDADGLLLIGDEALKAKKTGIKGFPVVTDLGQEWHSWQKLPFVFARWVAKRELPKLAKVILKQSVQKSLQSIRIGTPEELKYWDGFAYELTSDHEKSILLFKECLERVPSGV